jgi:molybdenum cofactor biosynthesis enzyme MoaA
MGLDSIEKTWLSFRRAWDFMPKDSAVAIKLARVQDAKIKRVFADIRAFQDRYPFINQMSLSELENWQNTFSQLEKKTLDAMILQAELSQLPLTEANKKAVRQNQVFYETILNFFHKAIEGVAVEVSGRR